jgi:hypothetical protein
MRQFVVTKKTGFAILDPNKPLIIRDARGILFYTTETLTKKPTCFNMPPFGKFFIEDGNGISPLKNPVPYKLANLPPMIRRFDDPDNFKIIFGINPNKCTVKWNDKIFLFDSMFRERPLPQIFFILYHEYGHAFTNNEKIADRIASNYMKMRGFNPSQIGAASINALSERQLPRKQELVNSLLGTQ